MSRIPYMSSWKYIKFLPDLIQNKISIMLFFHIFTQDFVQLNVIGLPFIVLDVGEFMMDILDRLLQILVFPGKIVMDAGIIVQPVVMKAWRFVLEMTGLEVARGQKCVLQLLQNVQTDRKTFQNSMLRYYFCFYVFKIMWIYKFKKTI